MAIICNLKSQHLKRDYTVIDASFGYASVELRNPSASENTGAFEVEASEVTNVRVIGEDGIERRQYKWIEDDEIDWREDFRYLHLM